jgi:hypothetical protein
MGRNPHLWIWLTGGELRGGYIFNRRALVKEA